MAKKITNIEGLGEEGKDLAQGMNDLLKSGLSVQRVMEMISQAGKSYTKSLQQSSSEMDKLANKLDDMNGGYSDLSSKIRNIEDANNDILKSFKTQEFALRNNLEISEAEAILARQDLTTQMLKNGLTLEERDLLLSKYDELQKNLKIQEKEATVAAKIKDYEEEREIALAGITEKSKVLKDIITDQRVAAAVFTNQLFKGYNTTKELFGEVRAEGHTISQAFHETGVAMYDAFSIGGTSAKDSLEVMKGMRSEMGSIEKVTSDARREAASLAKTYGVTNEQAGKLTATFATMPGATMESANNSLEFAGNMAKAAGVAPGEVMQDIANNSEDVAAFTKDGGKNIGVAAVAAKKLGMEFGSLTKMADQLLDFESSINKQMEASVLLGKEINLDKAREAAMNGDIAGMTKEVLANVGGEAEFNKMNFMQRKALAESLGVSVTDLGKMVKNQDELNNLTQEQQEALASGELTMDEALANAGGLADKLYEGGKTVGSMVIGFGEISNGLKEGVEASKELFGGIMGGIKGMKGGGGIKGGIKGMLGGADKAGDLAEQGAKGLDKASDVSKKVPGPAQGKGIKAFFKNLAAGLKEFGKNAGPVLKGVGVLALAGVLMAVGLGAIALAISALGGSPMDMVAIGGALVLFAGAFWLMSKALGNVKVSSVIQGSLAMVILGGAMVVAAAAFMMIADVPVENIIAFSIALPLLGLAAAGLGFLIVPIALGAIALGLLGVGMMSMGAGLMVLQAGKDGLDSFQSFLTILAKDGAGAGFGAFALAGGMLSLGFSSWMAFPGLMLAAAGLNLLVPALTLVNTIAESDAMVSLGESMVGIASAGPGLALVGASLVGIAGGLSLMALSGLMALPIIGSLIALAAVAPALSGLMGGGGKEGEDDKMQLIADKLDQLIAVASKGGEVNMDGKKVGQIIKLGLNSSNVR